MTNELYAEKGGIDVLGAVCNWKKRSVLGQSFDRNFGIIPLRTHNAGRVIRNALDILHINPLLQSCKSKRNVTVCRPTIL